MLNSLAAVEAPAPFAASGQYVKKREAAVQEGGGENGEDDEDEDGMSDETLELPGNKTKNNKKCYKKKDSKHTNNKNKKKKSKNIRSDKCEVKNATSNEALVRKPEVKNARSDEALFQSKPEVKNARPDEALVQSKPEVKTARSLKRARSDEAPVENVIRTRSNEALQDTDPDENTQTADDETEAPAAKSKRPNVYGKYKAGLYACKRFVFIKRIQERFPKMSFWQANRYWLKCPERMELLADMPLPELKRRRFAPKGCTVHPYR